MGALGAVLVLLLITLLGAAYIISPVDLIPDAIPVVGWIDDLGALGWVIKWWFKRQSRKIAIRIFIIPALCYLAVCWATGVDNAGIVIGVIAAIWGYIAVLRDFHLR